MYCVKCGVKLQEGVGVCPLCGTPVWNPEDLPREKAYPDTLPRHSNESDIAGAAAMLVLTVLIMAVTLVVCLKLYGSLAWGGYVIGATALLYIVAFLPRWFHHPMGQVFIPAAHAAAALYVLYIDLATGGRWFLSFAFPILLGSCLITTAVFVLVKYLRGGRLFIFGGCLVLLGLFSMLVEFFQHLTFGSPMFLWSPYSLSGFGAAGLFLILAGIIPPLRHALEKRFFF